MLHADEIKLAGIEEEIAEGIKWGDLARSGALNGKLVNDITEKGWEEIDLFLYLICKYLKCKGIEFTILNEVYIFSTPPVHYHYLHKAKTPKNYWFFCKV